MKIKESINKLETSEKFISWRAEENNKESYLAHIFKMMDEANKESLQIGYYNKERDRISTFVIDTLNNKVTLNPESEVFKEPGKSINPLNLEKLKINYEDALGIVDETIKKEYPNTIALKKFFILQTLPESGTVFNTTVLTSSFKTINIRVNAEDNEVLSHKLVEFMKGTPHK